MRIKLQLICEQFHGFLLVLLFSFLLASNLFSDQPVVFCLRCLILLVPYLTSYFGSRYCKHLAVYLLLSAAACMVCVLFGSSLLEQIYLGVFSVLIPLIRIPARLAQRSGLFDTPSPGVLSVFAAGFFFSLFLKHNVLQSLVYCLTFIYLINLILWYNFRSLNGYLHTHKDTAQLPGHQIIATNRVMMILFLVVAVLFLVVLPLLPLDDLVTAVGTMLRDLIRWIFSHFSAQPPAVEEVPTEAAGVIAGSSPLLEAGEETPAWLTALYNILFFTFTGIVITGILISLGFGIYRLFQMFYRPVNTTGDEQEFIRESTTASFLDPFAGRKAKEHLGFALSRSAMIRRQYKKTIRKQLAKKYPKDKRSLSPSLTPTQIEAFAGTENDSVSPELHALYEEARYAKEFAQTTKSRP